MRIRVHLCIWATCVLVVPLGVSPSNGQPTAGGQPAFATRADVKISTIHSLIESKDYVAAEQMAEEVSQEAPDLADAWIILGYTRSLNGKFELSNDAYDQALSTGAERKDILTRKAYNCRKLGDAEAARACYQGILEEAPNDTEVLMQFGSFELKADNPDAAAQCFDAVLSVQPDHIDAIEAMSRIEEKRESPAQAKYWLEKGLSVEPENTKFLKRLSLIYLNEQNYTMAVHYLDRLIAIDPQDAGAHRNKGIAFYQQGNKRKALDAFESVRTEGGSLNGLYGPLADCYRSVGRSNDAIEIVREGIAAGDQEAWLYSVWGKILEDRKDYDGAISKFNKAVTLSDEPWSGYARKQIARQAQLKKRAAMIASQGG